MRSAMNHQILMLVVCGTAMGCLFKYLNIPGGCMLGAVVGSMTVKLLGIADAQMPSLFYNAAQIAIGICVGSMISLDMLAGMKDQIPVMVLSTVILLLAGLGSAFVVRHMTDLDVTSSILATSPGGLNAVIGLADAAEHLPTIMAFQMMRLYVVILLVPVFCWCMKFFFHK
ncbi:AbrB family transcriptional regulator [Mailhella massiliensis]|uniref:AbrB family transcriptional regulator n=1 Tax=Mailhella massiliensis TaxID=1903261 RepID=A0A921DQ60_9BACT|nr:AbrB family transcriptional regulator [Mailhella massiliensis]HJD96079.1 AbrB family transcriptional regulator [Mailhella massiliensis]